MSGFHLLNWPVNMQGVGESKTWDRWQWVAVTDLCPGGGFTCGCLRHGAGGALGSSCPEDICPRVLLHETTGWVVPNQELHHRVLQTSSLLRKANFSSAERG